MYLCSLKMTNAGNVNHLKATNIYHLSKIQTFHSELFSLHFDLHEETSRNLFYAGTKVLHFLHKSCICYMETGVLFQKNVYFCYYNLQKSPSPVISVFHIILDRFVGFSQITLKLYPLILIHHVTQLCVQSIRTQHILTAETT